MTSRVTCDRVILTLPAGEKGDRSHPTTQALRRVNLDPSLPPQGILVVRKLSPNTPLANGWQPIRTWEQQAQAQLTQNWRTAARPTLGPVPPSANAVWFADSAEWLACLSWDLFVGTARQRWWWQFWLKASYPNLGHTLFSLWHSETRWLPQTLRLLYTRQGQAAISVIAELTDAQAIALTQQIQIAYQLSDGAISSITSPAASESSPTSQIPSPSTGAEQQPQPFPLGASEIPIPPSPALSPSQKTFVQLCFTLAYSPASLRKPSRGANGSQPSSPASKTSYTEPLVSQSPTTPSISHRNFSGDSLNGSGHSSADAPTGPSASNQDFQTQMGYEAEPQSLTSLSPDGFPRPEIPHPSQEHFPKTDVLGPQTLLPGTDNTIPLPPHPLTPSPLPTQLGGLWYLVNLLTPLQWPHPDLCPNPWHQLYILAQHLLSDPIPDPVWQLLLDLSETDLPDSSTSWLQTTLPLVHTYLTSQLPHPLPPSPHRPIAPYLPTPAHIHPSRTHIDIVFSLDQIFLDLRLAGLDRNPGWVPELARVITFHYL